MTHWTEKMLASRALMKERTGEVAARYAQGESAASLAAELGVTGTAITNAVRRAGGTVRPKGTSITPELAAAIRAFYEAGHSSAQTSEEFGVGHHCVSRAIREAGGKMRSRGAYAAHPPRGALNANWSGGRHVNSYGYVLVWLDPDSPLASMATKKQYVPEHRLVMAESLGRPLTRRETVHHINGDTTDNRLENLQLRSSSHGPGVRFECCACGSNDVRAIPL